ncbi:MAG: cyclic nucleotide-binding protein [Elusimicrobia bacterium HGW-Elusimicrobia-3]|nr:MAG: cyclic nucleotide-binding protein [Elusimicrobia bacterium HGW-Elusimicrobia-3]
MTDNSAETAATPTKYWADAGAGLAAMLVALPSAIAFGVAMYAPLGPVFAGAGALAGVIGTIAIGLVAPALGGAPRLISAPCAPAAAVMAALCAQLVAGGGSPEGVIASLMLVGLFSGLLQALYGALGGGRLIKYIPYPVVTGYMSGVGLLIILKQIAPALGLVKAADPLAGLFTPGAWQWPALGVATVTAAVMLLAPRFTRRVPAAILGLAAGILAHLAAGLLRPALLAMDGNPFVIGAISASPAAVFAGIAASFGGLHLPSLEQLKLLIGPTLTLSVLLSIDTLKTCVVTDSVVRSRHNSNRELTGQGAANVTSALLGGMPGAGTLGATMVSLASGGQTRAAGIMEGAFALAAALLLGGTIGRIPLAALAGILVVVGARMIDRSSVRLALKRSTILDFAVVIAVAGTALVSDLIVAAGVGIAFSMLLFIREQMNSNVIRRKATGLEVSSKQQRLPRERAALNAAGAQTLVVELQGSLFFGTTDQLFSEIEADLRSARRLIIDMRRVTSVDFTAVHMLEQVGELMRERGGALVFSHLPASLPTGQDLRGYFKQLGLTHHEGAGRVFETLHDALEWAEDRILEEAGVKRLYYGELLDLGEIDFLREMDELSLADLRVVFKELRVTAGDAIFLRKGHGEELFLIRRGRVRVVLPLKETHRPHHLAVFGPGDFFGEVAFLNRTPRTADALALTDTDLYVIGRTAFDEIASRNPVVGAAFYQRLATVEALRLRDADRELRRLQDS